MIAESDFEYREEPIPEPSEGQVLVQNQVLSFEPAMRGWVEDRPSYLPPVKLGDVMRASGAGEVVASRHPGFAIGDRVRGFFGWQDFALLDAAGEAAPVPIPTHMSSTQALSLFGMTTLTAYFGLFDIGRPEPGETVVVSGAAGATGSAAAQMARLTGCRVIGIAGGSEKCSWLRDVARLDEAVDYKSEDVGERVAELCPDGVNLYFDNVGGETLEQLLDHVANRSRVVLCGAISGLNLAEPAPGPRNLRNLITRRVRMEGFVVLDYFPRIAEAMKEIEPWAEAGELVIREDVQEGMANVPRTLLRLFRGENLGKQLLRLDAA
jgi:hypothetical protein